MLLPRRHSWRGTKPRIAQQAVDARFHRHWWYGSGQPHRCQAPRAAHVVPCRSFLQLAGSGDGVFRTKCPRGLIARAPCRAAGQMARSVSLRGWRRGPRVWIPGALRAAMSAIRIGAPLLDGPVQPPGRRPGRSRGAQGRSGRADHRAGVRKMDAAWPAAWCRNMVPRNNTMRRPPAQKAWRPPPRSRQRR